MESLRKNILKQVAEKSLSQGEAKQLLNELKNISSHQVDDIIAIIGMAVKLPGANNVDQFWENLLNGINCVGNLPEERRKDFSHILKNPHYTEFLAGGFVPEEDIGKDLYAKGAYLDEIDKFDADFFGISPREARFMDPNQRFFLQTAWEAIEDAGYGGDKIVGTNTAILAGKENSNTLLYKYITEQDPMHLTGSWESIMTSRIAYLFDLKGPCMVVDTACSSGLVAIHMACQLLRLKHSDMAIAGGINLTYGAPEKVKGPLDLSSIESTDSTVRTFDKNANGTVWGEGVAIMLLKPLKKALADGDNIHAIIKGSAMNNDGASNGITAPNAEAQEEVLVTTWKEAIINPETIGYIEAHGTGTVLGDPIEIKGLTNAFQRYTSKKQFCGIGSLKSNLGHLVATSGVVSLVKIVLSLKHKKIAPTINFSDPNPYINFCDSPFYVCNIPQNWESSQLPRRAGASSFGFSGTNCHMIVEEYIEQRQFNEHEPAYKCLTLSAKSEEQIQELLERYDTFLNKQPHEESPADICYTSNIGRGHYSHRLLLLVKNREELKEKIHFLQSRNLTAPVDSNIFYGYHRIVSASKPDRGPGEVTMQDVRTQSDKAQEIINKVKFAKDSNLETLLQKLASLYITGADINWDILYDGARRKRVSLPIYPFKRTRVWAGPRISQIKSEVQIKQISHPLLDRCVIKSLEQDIYQTYFTTEKHWVLTDHRIMGKCVIPGTTYIEMAIRVSRYYYPDTSLDLRDIIFLTPLQVEDDEEKEVQTIIKKQDGHLLFAVVSKVENSETYIKHVEGHIYPYDDQKMSDQNMEAIRRKLGEAVDFDMVNSATGVFQFGPRWKSVQKVYYGENEESALCELELQDNFKADLEECFFHPAMMDNAVNIISQNIGEGTYLPLTYRSLKVYDKMPKRFFSYVQKNSKTAENLETITFDILLMDPQGHVFAEINNYTIKKVHHAEIRFADSAPVHYYGVKWEEQVTQSDEVPKKLSGVLIIEDEQGMGQKIARELRKSTHNVTIARYGSEFQKKSDNVYIIRNDEGDFERLLSRCSQSVVDTILYLPAFNNKNLYADTKKFDKAQKNIIDGAFNLFRGIVNQKLKGKKLVFITNSAFQVSGQEKQISPLHGALIGLGQVFEQEYPLLKCRSIDIDESLSVKGIIQEVQRNEPHYLITYRNNKRYIKMLEQYDKQNLPKEDIKLRGDGAYIITGGTGSLGLEIARHMSSQEKVNLVLVNRGKIPSKQEWPSYVERAEDERLCTKLNTIMRIEELGGKIDCYCTDISQENDVKTLTAYVRKEYGRINGIIHCAGVAGEGFLVNKNKATFDNVLLPKTKGTYLLDRYCQDDELDFFVLFSSIATLLDSGGQGDYTCANAFLNSFAAYRNKAGRGAIAINWPLWKDSGMGVDYQVSDEFVIFRSLSTTSALDAFDQMYKLKLDQVIPGNLNFDILANTEKLFFMLSPEIKEKLEKSKKKRSPQKQEANKGQQINVTIQGKSEENLRESEKVLAQVFAQVLGKEEIDVYDSFHGMGGDSLLATHLFKAIDSIYSGIIDISDIFSYPSVTQMAAYIDKHVAQQTKLEEEHNETDEDKLLHIIQKVSDDEMSVEDVAKIFES